MKGIAIVNDLPNCKLGMFNELVTSDIVPHGRICTGRLWRFPFDKQDRFCTAPTVSFREP